ncbi:MAG: winged helix-turn-helix transcriptional regulator [Chloroflexota bacterium]
MPNRSYGQYCGLARALEMVGERWALLIIRDLLVGPRRFSDLRRGLPKIPTNILTNRLKELERNGIVRRRELPRPASAVVYELTEYGERLDPIVRELGLWGAQSLGKPGGEEIITTDSMIMALRSTFRPEAATDAHITYEFHFGPITIHARVDDGEVFVAEGPVSDADLVVEAGPAVKDLLTGDVTAAEAIEAGLVQVSGDPALLERFTDMFRIPARPAA